MPNSKEKQEEAALLVKQIIMAKDKLRQSERQQEADKKHLEYLEGRLAKINDELRQASDQL